VIARIWRGWIPGELRLWDNEILIGWYAANDGSVRSKGTMYFVMHPHGISATGHWVGLSYDGTSSPAGAAWRNRRTRPGPWLTSERSRMPPPADDVCEVTITAPDPDWLVEFTRRLVTDRLCASGHNFQPIRAIYRWPGQVHDKTEGRVALRTPRSLLPRIVDRAKREHPYEVPSVVAVPIIDGGSDYIGWSLEQAESSER
jgi:periplasmic divalent cation tolerance protein